MSHLTFTRVLGRIADGGILSTTWGELRLPRGGSWTIIGAQSSAGGVISARINRTDNGDTPPTAEYGEDCTVGYDRWQVIPPAAHGLRAADLPISIEQPGGDLPVQFLLTAGTEGATETPTVTFQRRE